METITPIITEDGRVHLSLSKAQYEDIVKALDKLQKVRTYARRYSQKKRNGDGKKIDDSAKQKGRPIQEPIVFNAPIAASDQQLEQSDDA